MEGDCCPICWGPCKKTEIGYGTIIECSLGHDFTMADSMKMLDSVEEVKCYNLIAELLLRTPYKKNENELDKRWCFFYDETTIGEDTDDVTEINLANKMIGYPKSFSQKMDRILMNISMKYTHPQDSFTWNEENARILFCESIDADNMRAEAKSLLDLATEMGYLKRAKEVEYAISALGWQRITQLQNAEQASNQGFIAMKFGEETRKTREAFRKGITECGYSTSIIDEKEHNNQIVPEIFSEIEKSKFIVVDVTVPNYGAYYEAGYAQGLGKEVIVCCKKNAFDNGNNPHFDIAQKSMVIWDTEEDLVERLVRRIDATVGKNI